MGARWVSRLIATVSARETRSAVQKLVALGRMCPHCGFEERAARLRVCGREHDSKAYVCGGRSIAVARVGDLWVTVELPTAFLDGQAFELHDEAEFE